MEAWPADREEAVVSSISRAVQRCANWPVVLAALIGAVGCVAGLTWRRTRLQGMELDTEVWYTPQQAATLLDALNALEGNATLLYAVTALTIDMLFPVCYGLLLAVVLFRLFPRGAPLWLLPRTTAAADVLENATVAALALSHDGTPSPLAWPAAVLTRAKWVLTVATLAATVVGAALRLQTAIRRLD